MDFLLTKEQKYIQKAANVGYEIDRVRKLNKELRYKYRIL